MTRGAYLLGERLEATMVYFPSAVPLRALLGEVIVAAQSCADDIALPSFGLRAARLEYERAICAKPWLGPWPMGFRNARLRRNGEHLFLCSSEDESMALPLLPSQATSAMPLVALETIDGIGLWDGFYFRLFLAQTEYGRWGSE
jgi:hypothetical protein